MTFNYNRDIPNAPNNPSNDQPLMKTNTNSIEDLIAVDHIKFNLANGGYHNDIHFQTQGADPITVPTIGQLYTKNVTVNSITDTQLFFRTGLGGISQLTGNFAGINGYVWVNGILLNWGVVNGTHSSKLVFDPGDTGTISFSANNNISFPNNCFGVWANGLYNSNTTAIPTSQFTAAIDQFTLSKTSFTYAIVTNSAQYTQFFWVALGN